MRGKRKEARGKKREREKGESTEKRERARVGQRKRKNRKQKIEGRGRVCRTIRFVGGRKGHLGGTGWGERHTDTHTDWMDTREDGQDAE